MPGHNSKHRHPKTVVVKNGEKAYHYVMFNVNLDKDDATNTRNMGEPEGEVRTKNRDAAEREMDKENLEMLSRLENHTFENPHMMSHNPFDVLKYLVLSKMMHQDLVPKFVAGTK
jgi:hypothetical protein